MKKIVLLSLALTLLIFRFNGKCLSQYLSPSSEMINDAEQALFESFEYVLDAESEGANVSSLIPLLNEGIQILENATILSEKGDFEAASSLIDILIEELNIIRNKASNIRLQSKTYRDSLLKLAIGAIVIGTPITLLVIWLEKDPTHRSIIFLFAVLLLAVACWPFFSTIYPVSGLQSFFTLGLLGREMKLDDYYPYSNTSIPVDLLNQWHLFLHNHMNKVSFVEVRVKIINSTSLFPDSENCVEAPSQSIHSMRRVFKKGEVLYLPFYWKILEIKRENNVTSVKQLEVNGKVENNFVPISSFNDFYLILEIWIYDESIADFNFAWESNKENYCSWNMMTFKILSLEQALTLEELR